MNRLRLCVITATLVSFTSIIPAHGASTLFEVQRSTNVNQLSYELSTSVEEPIHAFWTMLAEDGQVEELTSVERSYVYGVQIIQRNAADIVFSIEAIKEIPIRASLVSGQASIKVDGQDRVLTKIYFEMNGGLFPSAKSVTMTYLDGTLASDLKLVRSDKDQWLLPAAKLNLVQNDSK